MSKILILDLETTGFLNQNGKIVEIGIVELDLTDGSRKIIYNQVCHEKGITMEEVSESWIVQNSDLNAELIKYSPSLDRIRPTVQKILDDYPLGATAFNNAFDFGFCEAKWITFPKKLDCPMLLSTDICQLPSPRGGLNGLKFKRLMISFLERLITSKSIEGLMMLFMKRRLFMSFLSVEFLS
jgi:DNA polymerase III epsilon subunit-like protein